MRSPLEIARDLAEARDNVEHFREEVSEIEKRLAAVSDPDKFGPGVRNQFTAAIRFNRARLEEARRRVKTLRAELQGVRELRRAAQ